MAKHLLGKEVTAAMNEKLQARVAALKEKGVDLVICCRLRSRTAFSLRQKRIEMITGARGEVRDVLLGYLSGERIGLENN